jgi:hypothetical protein
MIFPGFFPFPVWNESSQIHMVLMTGWWTLFQQIKQFEM